MCYSPLRRQRAPNRTRRSKETRTQIAWIHTPAAILPAIAPRSDPAHSQVTLVTGASSDAMKIVSAKKPGLVPGLLQNVTEAPLLSASRAGRGHGSGIPRPIDANVRHRPVEPGRQP